MLGLAGISCMSSQLQYSLLPLISKIIGQSSSQEIINKSRQLDIIIYYSYLKKYIFNIFFIDIIIFYTSILIS